MLESAHFTGLSTFFSESVSMPALLFVYGMSTIFLGSTTSIYPKCGTENSILLVCYLIGIFQNDLSEADIYDVHTVFHFEKIQIEVLLASWLDVLER